MAYTPVNFINGVTTVQAAWLNGVDEMVYNVLNGWAGQTVLGVQQALGVPTAGAPLPITLGGTGEPDAADALAALGGVSAAGVAAIISADYAAGSLSPFPALGSETSPTNLNYGYGNVLRFGADPTGVADSTTAFANALLSSTYVYAPGGTYKLSNTLNMRAGQTLYGDGSATILQYASGSLTNIEMSGISRAIVRDLLISVTGTGFAGEAAGIYMLNATNCFVERVEMVGCNWSGVWLDAAANYNTVRGCYFHGFSEPAGSGGDVRIYSAHGGGTVAPSYNIIEDNIMYGGGGFGVGIEDPDAATVSAGFPSHNLVKGNRIGAHLTYGMMNYLPGGAGAPSTNTGNQWIGNYVENVSGLCPTNNSSGAGFYQVGIGGGGTIIMGNEIISCCTNTANRSLAPAGISVSGFPTGLTQPIIKGNTVTTMVQGDGILVVSSPGGAIVTGNSITMPSTNNGTGPGGATMQGTGIRVEASSNVTLGPNTVTMFGPGAALFIYANGINNNEITVSGGTYGTFATGTGNPLQVTQNGSFNVQQLQITGTMFNSNSSADALNLNAIVGGVLSGCIGLSTTGRGLFLNGCLAVRVSGGEYLSASGATAIGTSGTCTSCFIDKSCYWGGASGLMNNAGTGATVEWYVLNSTVPTTGTFAVGDHAIPRTPASGSPKGWYTTVAGTPGTQTSEGNL